jgi:hypothetical protein
MSPLLGAVRFPRLERGDLDVKNSAQELEDDGASGLKERIGQATILLLTFTFNLVEAEPFDKIGTLFQTTVLYQPIEIFRAEAIALLELLQLAFECMQALQEVS